MPRKSDREKDAKILARYLDPAKPPIRRIAEELGISHNSVATAVRRTGAANRGTPIRRNAKPPESPPILRGSVTLPLLGIGQSDLVLAAPPPAPARRCRESCCWPTSRVGARGFRFCEAEALVGKPYCAAHAAIAYRRPAAGTEGQSTHG